MTLATFNPERLAAAGEYEISDQLEAGEIVFFPTCPVPLPTQEELVFLREELPRFELWAVSAPVEVRFARDEEGDVSGFYASFGRTRDVWFQRF